LKLTIEEFKGKFKEIKDMGYVHSQRKGATGIGYTLGILLGINENNDISPDIEGAELKAHRANSNTLITLFTFDNKAWKMQQLEAIKKFGNLDKNGRQRAYYTMSPEPNSAGLFLDVQKDTIAVRHISRTLVVEWHLEKLTER